MAGAQNMPPPPGGPPPPPPHALPMHAGGPGPMPGQQQHGPQGNMQHAGGMHGGAQFGGGNKDNQREKTPIEIYRFFKIRKPTAREVGGRVRPSWNMATCEEVHSMSSTQIKEEVQKLRGKTPRSAVDEYNSLESINMQGNVDKLLKGQRTEEPDPKFEWHIAAIEKVERQLPQYNRGMKAQTEIGLLRIYIKRALKAEYVTNANKPDNKSSGIGQANLGGAAGGPRPGPGNQFASNGLPGGPGGFQPGPPGGPPIINGVPGQGINPPPVTVTVNQAGRNNKNKGKDKRNGRGRRRSRSGDNSPSESESESDSDRSSNSNTRRHRKDDEIEKIRDAFDDIGERLQNLGKRNNRRRGSSPSDFRRPPMGANRHPSHDRERPRRPEWVRRKGQSSPQKYKVKEKVRYDWDESDTAVNGNSTSYVSDWIGGQSTFSRPPSDSTNFTPPPSPPLHHRRSPEFNAPPWRYREHRKPPRNNYPSPPRSPGHMDDQYYNGGMRHNDYPRRPSNMERRQTYPQYAEDFSDHYQNPHYDGGRRNTFGAHEHMRSNNRPERFRNRDTYRNNGNRYRNDRNYPGWD
ncbi:hypothetical protein NA57DRAFT_51239 [Rhizodiscina lignyota]|uniref:Uncharacterized protein n=1 Tax=Rhizodiscina lignyota TaxID=1504668 RepID=A0A9P4MEF4_9PEZI|nr:hypothetical protein NA57DRAFT_51239 [Rhizodiscina lignyota]